MIGASAAALLLGNGDVLGASGIISSVALSPKQTLTDPSQHWKLYFIGSFLSVSTFYLGSTYSVAEAIAAARPLNLLGYTLSGVLVGFGTRLSNGCTSGHGVCGLARLSRRSFAAVGTFMATGIATAIITSPKMSWASWTSFLRTESPNTETMASAACSLTAIVDVAAVLASYSNKSPSSTAKTSSADDAKKVPAAILSGALFSAGLYTSTMAYPGKVLGFLTLTELTSGTWDGTLIGVLGGAVVVSYLSYQFLRSYSHTGSLLKHIEHPLALSAKSQFSVPTNASIDNNLLVGAALFGIGWGISGFCPGPALFAAGAGFPGVLMGYWPGFLIGSSIATELRK